MPISQYKSTSSHDILVDTQNRGRSVSVASSQDSPTWDQPDSSGSSRESFHVGMPTFLDIENERSRTTTPESSISHPIVVMPYSSNPDFIGRSKILAAIKESLNATHGTQGRVALYGLGGIG